jgi:uncharacterized C2H2 Zn-finger protein
MKQLKVRKNKDGKPVVECPGCGELVSPVRNPLLDGYDCSECGAVMQEEQMHSYAAEVEEAASKEEEDEYGS